MWLRPLYRLQLSLRINKFYKARSPECYMRRCFGSSCMQHLSIINCQRLYTKKCNKCLYKHYSTERLSDQDMKKCMEELGDKFSEARELLTDARESIETVYFSEDMKEAEEAVKDTLEEYDKLLQKLDEKQKEEVVRTIGLRMEELKAQVSAIHESLHE